MNTPAILVMGAAALGMVLGLAQLRAGRKWGMVVAAICALVVVGAAFRRWKKTPAPADNSGKTAIVREQRFLEAAGEVAGDYLAEHFAGATILLLTDARNGIPDNPSEPLVRGFRQGLGTALSIIAEVSPTVPEAGLVDMPPKDALTGEEGTPQQEFPPPTQWFTARRMDKLLAEQEDFDLLVTTIGLPADSRQSAFLGSGRGHPRVVFLCGDFHGRREAFDTGRIAAAVAPKSNADFIHPAPDNAAAAFALRYVLVTPANVRELASREPGLFRSGAE